MQWITQPERPASPGNGPFLFFWQDISARGNNPHQLSSRLPRTNGCVILEHPSTLTGYSQSGQPHHAMAPFSSSGRTALCAVTNDQLSSRPPRTNGCVILENPSTLTGYSQMSQPNRAMVPFSSSGKQSGTRITGADGLLSQSGQPHQAIVPFSSSGRISQPEGTATPSYTHLQPATPSYNQLKPATTSFNQLQPATPSYSQMSQPNRALSAVAADFFSHPRPKISSWWGIL